MSQLTTAVKRYNQLVVELDQAHPKSIDPIIKRLPEAAASLPPLTPTLLTHLAEQAETLSLQNPRCAWLLMALADAAAQQQADIDPLLAAQATFQHGRFANEFGRPKLARQAVERAEAQFRALNEPGWLAATTWQRYALPWAITNLVQAIADLNSAHQILQDSPPPLATYAPLCQLTLANAKMVVGDLDDLPDLLQHCQSYFTEMGDTLQLARTRFVHSGYLRRTAPFEKAIAVTEEGLAMVQSLNAAADIGRFYCQKGFNDWLGKADYRASIQSFQTAIDLFRSLDIPAWMANCQVGLAQIYIMTGNLSEATDLIQSALITFQAEEAPGQVVFTLFDASWLERTKGNYLASLDYLKRAQKGYELMGLKRRMPVVLTGLGDTYLQLGRFQQALQSLEQAFSQLLTIEDDFRLAECCLRLARLWTRLDDPNQARSYLNKVKEYAQKVEHASALLAYYQRSAELHNDQGNTTQALNDLTQAIQLAQQQENPAVEILCRRQLAKAYAQRQQLELATEQLTIAEAGIKAMGLQHEHAACLLIWGDIYQRQGRPDEASAAWTEAEKISRTILPDLNWQAAAALAEQAQEKGQKEQAFSHYRQMLKSLAQLRQGFWQPELAGSYLKRPSHHLNRAVLLSASSGQPRETLTFIEETKAQTTARQLQAKALFQEIGLLPPEAREMMSEIRWLQEKLQTGQKKLPFPLRSTSSLENYELLREKISDYGRLINRVHRQQLDSSQIPVNNGFDLDLFRQQANQNLGSNWAALDYYQVGSRLICFLLTPKTAESYPFTLPPNLLSTLDQLSWLKNSDGKPPLSILKAAGNLLFPTAVREQIQQDSTLIIAPHRDLHHLPWAGLHYNSDSYQPLIAVVNPVLIPSLQTLSLLWQRPAQPPAFSKGLLLAVSDFQDRHTPLPAVQDEATRLLPVIGSQGHALLEQNATAPNLLAQLSGEHPDFDFWHIASHAFYNGHSGHLSGLALYDRDFLLDEFWQLAPLPNLVTFSACGSSKSQLFEGDEPVGLTTTCLTAGANHVIGSIWNILDSHLPGIMADFYAALQSPIQETAVPVAYALAQAQRQAWNDGKSWQQWAGFRCTGRP